MEDTIHMGWNGWLAFDKAVNPFVTKAEKAPTYHLNDRFFSRDWAQYKGTPDEFKLCLIKGGRIESWLLDL